MCSAMWNFEQYYIVVTITLYNCNVLYDRKPSSESLHTAMRNVERYYAVVGIAEELPGFMQVLEYIAPRYFRRGHDVFIKNGKCTCQISIKCEDFPNGRHPPIIRPKFFQKLHENKDYPTAAPQIRRCHDIFDRQNPKEKVWIFNG